MGIFEDLRSDIEVRQIFAVFQGGNGGNFGHPGAPKWWFLDVEIAKSVAEGRGWYGGNAAVHSYTAIVIDNTKAYLLANETPIEFGGPEDDEDIKQQALSKLNAHEKRVLGLG